ncbi:fam-d protein [Plasmodium vinckei petteri]|uniref:Fam-d protein n=1 Tax=Plasmodium vinckei petteri TaxID=138298 RepID=A0A6V7SZV5_PLAVN|nr:fam-d protein [Plasmodium vinckei petteri]
MRSIILSFFILVIFSIVKAATLQDANNSRPQSVGYVSVPQAFFKLHNYDKKNFKYLEIINCILRYEPENTNYAYQGNNYHWVITDFDISINNSVRNFNDNIFLNKPGAVKGTAHFISYIKENIKCLVTQHISKYDFENNHDDSLKKLSNDLKGLIYDKFDKDSEGKIYDEFVNDLKGSIYDKYGNDLKGLIYDKSGNDLKGSICNKFRKYLKGLKYDKSNNDLKQSLTSSEDKTASQKLHKKAKNFFKILLDNSNIMIRGYVIKIRKDGNYMDLCQNKSLYFNISISRNDANATHDFRLPQPEVVKLVANL